MSVVMTALCAYNQSVERVCAPQYLRRYSHSSLLVSICLKMTSKQPQSYSSSWLSGPMAINMHLYCSTEDVIVLCWCLTNQVGSWVNLYPIIASTWRHAHVHPLLRKCEPRDISNSWMRQILPSALALQVEDFRNGSFSLVCSEYRPCLRRCHTCFHTPWFQLCIPQPAL